jgi:hypothetical protein
MLATSDQERQEEVELVRVLFETNDLRLRSLWLRSHCEHVIEHASIGCYELAISPMPLNVREEGSGSPTDLEDELSALGTA